MNINVNEFKEIIKKATLNHSIDSIHLKITKDFVVSRMINPDKNVVTKIELENNLISGIREDEFDFYFLEPMQKLVPFLNVVGDNCIIDVKDQKIVIKDTESDSKIDLFFSSPTTIGIFEGNEQEITNFYEEEITDDFVSFYTKIKKIGQKFGKIYFFVEDNEFFIETSDRTNPYSNKIKFKIDEIQSDDLSLMINYKNFVNLMSVINGEYNNFKIMFAYLPEHEMGKITVIKNDDSEKYFLLSQEDI